MNEPRNSWEVSYVIAIKRPWVNLGISKRALFLKVGLERSRQLRRWAETEYDNYWFRDHI